MKILAILLSLVATTSVFAQKANETIRAGNDFYRRQEYDKAEKEYANALKIEPNNNTAKFNLANATYRSNKQDEAIKKFEEIAAFESDPILKSKAYYNKGAILSRQKKLEESIEAYKSTLRLNPDDKEARENLQKALLELKKKQPPKQKEDQQKKKQEQKQKQKQQPQMNRQEAEQRLKLLEQKEREVQQRLQKSKTSTGGSQTKDW